MRLLGSRIRRLRIKAVLLWPTALISLTVGSMALAQEEKTEPVAPVSQEQVAAMEPCLKCHESEKFRHPLHTEDLAASPHREMGCQDCHSGISGAPHTPDMFETKTTCADCHSDQQEAFLASSHSKENKVPGDHPNCVYCHGGGDPHKVKRVETITRQQELELCSKCHQDEARMARNNVDVDAFHSYQESFHGKSFLKFGMKDAAICTDCHGAHTVLHSTNPASPIHRDNADKLCSSAGCHPGAKVNFAMSGANHLRLKIKENAVLRGIDLFFRGLVFAVIGFMLLSVALDLWKSLFGGHAPRCGRLVGFLLSLSYFMIIQALILMMFERLEIASWFVMTSVILLAIAYPIYFMRRKREPRMKPAKLYKRFTVAQRVQHIILAVCFTTLILTGLPQRFFRIEWLAGIYDFMGGLANARYAHRIAAIGMIAVFLWHTTDLLIRWAKSGFSFKGWSMLPNKKDLQNAKVLYKNYLGLTEEEPKYGRYQFKQKLDYLAEYWGIPLMVVTGLMLWFPIFWGNRMPEIGLSAALVAHGWEATLAFLAIATWHIYNEHFHPHAFPMNPVWLTGTLSEEHMEREHPIELERIREAEAAAAQEVTASPDPAEPLVGAAPEAAISPAKEQ